VRLIKILISAQIFIISFSKIRFNAVVRKEGPSVHAAPLVHAAPVIAKPIVHKQILAPAPAVVYHKSAPIGKHFNVQCHTYLLTSPSRFDRYATENVGNVR
jgi:hypothetical protein